MNLRRMYGRDAIEAVSKQQGQNQRRLVTGVFAHPTAMHPVK